MTMAMENCDGTVMEHCDDDVMMMVMMVLI